mgnify:CR=1 FL=1
MNNEAAPTIPTEAESIDASNFARAQAMSEKYNANYVYASSSEKVSGIDVYREKQALIQSLLQQINPKTGSPYTNEELLCVYLYHVIIGGSLSSDSRDGFPMEMQYDVEGGLIEKFILSLPQSPTQTSSGL